MQAKRELERIDMQVAKMVERGPSSPSLETSKVSTNSLTTLASGWRWTGIEAKTLVQMSDLKTSAKNTDTHTQENIAEKKKRSRTHSRKQN